MLIWPGVGRLAAPALFSRASLALMLRAGTGTPRPHLDRHAHLGDSRQSRAIRTADAAGAHFVLFQNAGHFLPQERPAEVAAEIAALLDTPLDLVKARIGELEADRAYLQSYIGAG